MTSYSPSYIIMSIITSLFSLYDTFVSVLLLKFILDGIANRTPISEIILYMVVVFSIGLIVNLFNSWCSNIYFPKYGQGFKKYMQSLLFNKALSLDLDCYDNPEILDEYVWSMNDAENRVFAVVSSLQSFFIAIINTIFLISVIVTLDFWLIFFVILNVLFSMIFSTKLSKIQYVLNKENIIFQRKTEYVKRIFYIRDYAKDLRLSQVPIMIKKMFNEAIESIICNIKEYGLKILVWDVILKIFSFVFSVLGIILYLTIRAYSGSITLGSFPALYNATTNLNTQLQSLFKIIPSMYENNLYIEKLYKFMNYEPVQTQEKETISSINNIEFRDVSFSYNSDSNNAVDGIDLLINKGDKIAIVGHNGAGKTTLINLLLKLYYPNSGEILVNGKNINEFIKSDYLEKFCVVAQDFKLYALTIVENILNKSEINEDEENKVLNSLRSVGLYDKIMLSPNGINTQYTKEFYDDGVIFSGGEEQKLAISKIFATNAEVIILDEPSSALDPISEYNIFNKIMEQLKDKTIVFISHRLYSTTLADKIIVLDDGKICECGSHKSLMEDDGRYAELFRMQSEKYLDNQ